MKYSTAISLLTAAWMLSSAAGAADLDGQALFKEKCYMCHNKTGMGTGLLSRRVQPAELLLRKDLVPAFVIGAARAGIGNMPAISRGEVSDAQLTAIANFLAAPHAATP
jgi:mono/diheme cytochrome c family protein